MDNVNIQEDGIDTAGVMEIRHQTIKLEKQKMTVNVRGASPQKKGRYGLQLTYYSTI